MSGISNVGPRPIPVPPPVPTELGQSGVTDVRKAEETAALNPSKEIEVAAVTVRETEAEFAALKQSEAQAEAAAALRETELAQITRLEEQAFKIGTSAERMVGQTTTTLVSIPGDTLHKQSKLPKALVPVTPASAFSTISQREILGAQVRYLKFKRVGYQVPEVNFVSQAKTTVPIKLVSAFVLVQTQKVAYDKLKDKMNPLAADPTSWFVAVSAENVVNIPINAIRHQIQTRRAKTIDQAVEQILKNKGVKGLYKAYPISTLSGTAVNIGLNSISPFLTSEVQKRFGSNFLTPFVTGAAGGLCALPFTAFTNNVNHYINEPHDKRSTFQIAGDLVQQGPRAMFHGAVRGARRIALIGAVYNSTIYGLRSGQEVVKVKHVEKVKQKLPNPPSLSSVDTDFLINFKLGSHEYVESVRDSGKSDSGTVVPPVKETPTTELSPYDTPNVL